MSRGYRRWGNTKDPVRSIHHLGGNCRVCGKIIKQEEEVLVIPFQGEKAHFTCGYWKENEKDK